MRKLLKQSNDSNYPLNIKIVCPMLIKSGLLQPNLFNLLI